MSTFIEQDLTIWNYLIYGTLFVMLTISIITDWKKHKIYNYVTYPAIFSGFILNSCAYGLNGFISCCVSLVISFVLFILFYSIKMIGAGDVKLIIAASVLTNVFYAFAGLIIGSLLAACYGAYVWLKTKNRKARIPYGIFIGIGFYIYQLLIIFIEC